MNLSRNRYWYFFRRRRHVTLSLDCTFGDDGASSISDLASGAADPAREAASERIHPARRKHMKRLTPDARKILVLRNTLDRAAVSSHIPRDRTPAGSWRRR